MYLKMSQAFKKQSKVLDSPPNVGHISVSDLIKLLTDSYQPYFKSNDFCTQFFTKINDCLQKEVYEKYYLIDLLYTINYKITYHQENPINWQETTLYFLKNYLDSPSKDKRLILQLLELSLYETKDLKRLLSLYLRDSIRQIAFRFKKNLDDYFFYLHAAEKLGLRIGFICNYHLKKSIDLNFQEVTESIYQAYNQYFELGIEEIIHYIIDLLAFAIENHLGDFDKKNTLIKTQQPIFSNIKEKFIIKKKEGIYLNKYGYAREIVLSLINDNHLFVDVNKASFIFYHHLILMMINELPQQSSPSYFITRTNALIENIETNTDCQYLQSTLSSISFQKEKLSRILWYALTKNPLLLKPLYKAISQMKNEDVKNILVEKSEPRNENAIFFACQIRTLESHYITKLIFKLDACHWLDMLSETNLKGNNVYMEAINQQSLMIKSLLTNYLNIPYEEKSNILLTQNINGCNLLMLAIENNASHLKEIIKLIEPLPIKQKEQILTAKNNKGLNAYMLSLLGESPYIAEITKLIKSTNQETIYNIINNKSHLGLTGTLVFFKKQTINTLQYKLPLRKVNGITRKRARAGKTRIEKKLFHKKNITLISSPKKPHIYKGIKYANINHALNTPKATNNQTAPSHKSSTEISLKSYLSLIKELPEEKQIKTLKRFKFNDCPIIHFLLRKNNPSPKTLINYLINDLSDNAFFQLMSLRSYKRESIMFLALCNTPEMVIKLIKRLNKSHDKKHLSSILSQLDKEGFNLLAIAAKNNTNLLCELIIVLEGLKNEGLSHNLILSGFERNKSLIQIIVKEKPEITPRLIEHVLYFKNLFFKNEIIEKISLYLSQTPCKTPQRFRMLCDILKILNKPSINPNVNYSFMLIPNKRFVIENALIYIPDKTHLIFELYAEIKKNKIKNQKDNNFFNSFSSKQGTRKKINVALKMVDVIKNKKNLFFTIEEKKLLQQKTLKKIIACHEKSTALNHHAPQCSNNDFSFQSWISCF